MPELVLIVHNVRSAHNVGSLLRTADGLGIKRVYLTGYSPYPSHKNDTRLPHIQKRVQSMIHKTALGAEESMDWKFIDNLTECVDELSKLNYKIVALEQTESAINISGFEPTDRVALVVGNEVTGLDGNILAGIDVHVHIPMHGEKESFNVSVATAIALYQIRKQQMDKTGLRV